jgi:hypothetical protein
VALAVPVSERRDYLAEGCEGEDAGYGVAAEAAPAALVRAGGS